MPQSDENCVETKLDEFAVRRAKLGHEFQTHQMASLFLVHAGDDYAAARCLIMNGLAAGFPLGAQALEKIMKALLHFKVSTEVANKERRHRLEKIFDQLKIYYPSVNQVHRKLCLNFSKHYRWRYPDDEGQSKLMSGDEIRGLDSAFIHFLEAIPVSLEFRMRHATFTAMLDLKRPILGNKKYYMTADNAAFNAVQAKWSKDFSDVYEYLYPDQE